MPLQVVSEGPVKITRAIIEAAWKRRASGARLVLRDAECRGLALVVNATAMSWTYSFKPRGNDPITGARFPTKSVTIGGPATHGPEDARIEANRLKDKAKGGTDPAAERRAKQAEDANRRAMTVKRLREAYLAELPTRPKMRGTGLPSATYLADETAALGAALAAMGAEGGHPSAITVAMVRKMLRACATQPATARHRFGALSRFMDWCRAEGHITVNICATLDKKDRPKPPAARARALTADRVAALWKAAGRMSDAVHRDYCRFVFIVPCRRSEAAAMKWEHLDLDAATWSQPAKLTKNGEPHRFHLPGLVLDILRARHDAAGRPETGLVFPAPKSGKELSTFSAIKAELDGLTAFSGWAWHDLRRSFVTALGEAGFSESVADAVLNHRQAVTRGGVLGVYQRAERWPERHAAQELWSRMVATAMDGKNSAGKLASLDASRLAKAG